VDALKRHPDVVGIYNAGAANDAVELALQKSSLKHRPIFIGHELTPQTAKMLSQGTMTLTIDQNPQQQARFAVDVLLHHFG
jgi:LacI family transcriptional regulator